MVMLFIALLSFSFSHELRHFTNAATVLTYSHDITRIRSQSISDSAVVCTSHTTGSCLTDCQYIGVCGGGSVSDSLSQMVGGAINGERLTILHPGDSGGWRPSGHTGQSTRFLLIGQLSDGGRIY